MLLLWFEITKQCPFCALALGTFAFGRLSLFGIHLLAMSLLHMLDGASLLDRLMCGT